MDTRKLIASGNAEEIRTDDGNMVATTDNRLVERTTSEKQELVRELVRRWNAYPELVEALKGAGHRQYDQDPRSIAAG